MNHVKELEYTVIKSKEQYYNYCTRLEELLENNESVYPDHIELLSALIEKWDRDHNTFQDLDPIQLLKSLMADHDLKAVHIAGILELSTGTVSKILSYKKGLSKDSIRKLSNYFKVAQEAFNRPYNLNQSTEPALKTFNVTSHSGTPASSSTAEPHSVWVRRKRASSSPKNPRGTQQQSKGVRKSGISYRKRK